MAAEPVRTFASANDADEDEEMGLKIVDSRGMAAEPVGTFASANDCMVFGHVQPLQAVAAHTAHGKRWRGKGTKKKKSPNKLNHSGDNAHYVQLNLRAGKSSASSMTPD